MDPTLVAEVVPCSARVHKTCILYAGIRRLWPLLRRSRLDLRVERRHPRLERRHARLDIDRVARRGRRRLRGRLRLLRAPLGRAPRPFDGSLKLGGALRLAEQRGLRRVERAARIVEL